MMFNRRKAEKPVAPPKTTRESLTEDGKQSARGISKTIGGLRDIASGATKAGWHTYTGALSGTFGYLSKHRNQAGVLVATATAAHLVLSNDNLSERITTFTDAAADKVCDILKTDTPICDYDEIGALIQTMDLDDPA